jgi:hypothetical protein
MTESHKQALVVLPAELEVARSIFGETPIAIIAAYLQSFDPEGRQVFEVPEHVLEALAARLLSFMRGDARSLDEAFGDRVARQRNRLVAVPRDRQILWDFLAELENCQEEAPSARGAGNPFEIAAERVAEKHRMSAENVKRIYKESGRR